MSYQSALDHLYARGVELAPVAGQPRRKFELEHMRSLAQALGDPQKRFRTILIAGTNGKGSTSSTLAHILAAGGMRVGLYTSPHLVRINERIQTAPPGGSFSQISDEDFARLYFQVDEAATELVRAGRLPHPPSFFEVVTAVGFLAFAEAGVDIVVLEVGLGGRLDATNIVEPEISVITDIALDHTEWLGDTISLIAREKAGILRENGVLVTLPQHPEANTAIGEIAVAKQVRGVNAAQYMPTRDVVFRPSAREANDREVSLTGGHRNQYTVKVREEAMEVDSPLPGEHQQRNIALAIASAVELGISNEAIAKGIRQTAWPGRLQQIVVTGPAGESRQVLLDVAHNPAGAWTLRSYLSRLPEDQPRTLLFSALTDKAVEEIAQILFPLFDDRDGHRIVMAPMRNPRAASREQLEQLAKDTDTNAEICASVNEAWTTAISAPGTIVVAGSVYLVGEVLPLLQSPDNTL